MAAWVAMVLLLVAGAMMAARPELPGVTLSLGLTHAVAVGVIGRLVRASKGKSVGRDWHPSAGAAETDQELLPGREPTSSAIEHSFPAVPDDRASSGSWGFGQFTGAALIHCPRPMACSAVTKPRS